MPTLGSLALVAIVCTMIVVLLVDLPWPVFIPACVVLLMLARWRDTR